MLAIILSSLTAFIITFLVIPVIIKLSKKKKGLLDKPGRRKIHKKRTPSLGGIGIFLGLFGALIVWMPFDDFQSYKYILAGISIIFFLGMRDDIVPLKPSYKLIGQLVASALVVFVAKVQLTSLYGLFGVYELPEFVGQAISLFTIIVITNSFNLIDGLDGLAGSIATIALTTFGIWFYLIGDVYTALLALTAVGAIISFLTFNWEPSKIFMGDTGALVIGFIFSVLAIYFIDTNYHLPHTNQYKFNASITTAICIIIIPLFDTLRIFILRVSKGRSPFSPDKNHMHHALMRLGLSHSQTTLSLAGLNLFYVAIAITLSFTALNDNIALPLVLVLSLCLSLGLDKTIRGKLTRN